MPSALDRVFSQGVRCLQASGHRRIFRIETGQSKGTIFAGTKVTAGVMDMNTIMGSDVREQSMIYVLRKDAPILESQTVISEGHLVQGQFVVDGTWKAVKRQNNETDVEVNYELIKKLAGDE